MRNTPRESIVVQAHSMATLAALPSAIAAARHRTTPASAGRCRNGIVVTLTCVDRIRRRDTDLQRQGTINLRQSRLDQAAQCDNPSVVPAHQIRQTMDSQNHKSSWRIK